MIKMVSELVGLADSWCWLRLTGLVANQGDGAMSSFAECFTGQELDQVGHLHHVNLEDT